MNSAKRILDVGQCGIDGPRIGRFLMREFNCAVDRAHTKDEALALAGKQTYDLILVNRVLARDGSPGLDVIAALHESQPGCRMMLVSDFPEAQVEAEKRGALKGFGKAALESDATEALLRSILSS